MAHCSHVICACYQNMHQNLFGSCKFATTNFAEMLYTYFAYNIVPFREETDKWTVITIWVSFLTFYQLRKRGPKIQTSYSLFCLIVMPRSWWNTEVYTT